MKKTTKVIILNIFLLTLMFTGCDLFMGKIDPQQPPEEYFITLNLAGLEKSSASSRTLLPSLPSGIEYHLSFSGPVSKETITFTEPTADIKLYSGTWTITAEAYDTDNAKKIASGTGTTTVPDSNNLNITLATLMEESTTGSMNITLNYTAPEGIVVDDVTAVLTNMSDYSAESVAVSGIESPVSLTADDLPVGSYMLVVDFTDTLGNRMNPYAEIVQIYTNLETADSVTRVSSSFTALPEAPSDLSGTDAAEGIILQWIDNATVETSFLIERMIEGGSYSQLALISSPNTTSYTDTTAVDGTTYYYRVLAVNSFGSSTPADELEMTVAPTLRVIYVSTTGNDANDGSSWADALTNLQTAIELSDSYTRKAEIWVAAGTYTPQTDPSSKGFNHYTLRQDVSLFGGFSGTETLRSERDPRNYVTLLSGDINGDDIRSGSGSNLTFQNVNDNSESIFYCGYSESNLITSSTEINGFTFTGGYGGWGGAIHCMSGSPRIANCVFTENEGGRAGAIYFNGGNLFLENCVFENNQATFTGAVNFSVGSEAIITNCIFLENYGPYESGALSLSNIDNAYIINCTFFDNDQGTNHGIIYSDDTSLSLINTIIQSEDCIIEWDSEPSDVLLINSVIQGFPESMNYSLTESSYSNIYSHTVQFLDSNNPKGADDLWMTADDGLQLISDNVTIETGSTDYMVSDLFDQDEDDDTTEILPYDILMTSRVQNESVDIGAYESSEQNTNPPASITSLEAEAANSTVNIQWTNPSDADLTNIIIQLLCDGTVDQEISIPFTQTSHYFTGLSDDVEYTFLVTAEDNMGNLSTTEQIIATPTATVVPDVSSVRVIPVNQALHILWDDPGSSLVETISINISPDPNLVSPIVLSKGVEYYVIDDLFNGTDYTVDIVCFDYSSINSVGIAESKAPSTILFVDTDASGSNNGADWSNALTNLSEAIKYATEGTDIWVSEGTYIPSSAPNYPEATSIRENHFTLKNGVAIYGGFSGSESFLSERDPWSNKTELSGDINNDDIVSGSGSTLSITNTSDNMYHVIFLARGEIDQTALLDGFTISGGCSVDSNYASTGTTSKAGGGLHSYQNDFLIRNSIFTENSGYEGGAVLVNRETGSFINCIFQNNYTTYGGGAIYIFYQSSLYLENCTFLGNYAEYYGGAIHAYNDVSLSINNSCFLDNYSYTRGGGVYLHKAEIVMNNSILSGNSSNNGENLHSYYTGTETSVNNCLIENYPDSVYFPDPAAYDNFTGTLTADPLLTDSTDPIGADNIWGTSDDGLWYTTSSPLYDGGNDSFLPADTTDMDGDLDITEKLPYDLFGNNRVQGSTVDIGAYELTP